MSGPPGTGSGVDRGYIWRALSVIALGSFMVVLDTTIVNIALPRIITIFGSTVEQGQLVLTGYMLALAVVMPATAYFGQTYGTKRVYLATFALFTIGSALCGAAWSVPSLIGARVLQGLGGGMIQPLGMGMLFRITPPERRGSVMAIFALPVMVAPILGPTLGGYLVEYVDWRWVFFLNLPVGALGLFLGGLLLQETPARAGVRFDAFGFVLAATFSAAALLAMEEAAKDGFGEPSVVAKLGLAVAVLPVFVWWELRTAEPLLNLRLFAIPAFSMGAVVNFVTTMALFGAIFLLPVFLQNLRGMGAMQTGMLLFPQALASAVSVVLGGRLYDKVGARPLMIFGLAGLGLSTWLLSAIDVTTPDSTLTWMLVMRGGSIGFAMMPAMTAWMAAAPQTQSQDASALSNVLRQVFGAASTALFASLLQSRVSYHQAYLAMFATPDMPAVARLLGEAQRTVAAQGLPLERAQTLVVAQLTGQVRLAAAVRGFDDCFLVAAVICALGIIPTLFLRAAPRAAVARHEPVEA
jgi:EmrB/QacA subfamily drug resistance transporter